MLCRGHGVTNVDDSGLTGYRPTGLRAYKLENASTRGQTIAQFRAEDILNAASSTWFTRKVLSALVPT